MGRGPALPLSNAQSSSLEPAAEPLLGCAHGQEHKHETTRSNREQQTPAAHPRQEPPQPPSEAPSAFSLSLQPNPSVEEDSAQENCHKLAPATAVLRRYRTELPPALGHQTNVQPGLTASSPPHQPGGLIL